MSRNATATTSNTLFLVGTNKPTTASVTGPAAPTNTQACNNYVEFCNRQYMNFTEVCAHNSAFVKRNNAAANQNIQILGQLNDGIRMIQGETHHVNNTIFSCHTSCDLLNAGPLQDELTTVRQWIDAHPYDVVTILLVNSDFVDVNLCEMPKLLQECWHLTNLPIDVDPIQNAGLGPYLYLPPKVPMHREDWPTLGDMILTNKRVVVFMDYNANQTQVPYILDEFSQMWETPYSPTDINFPCTQQRPPGLNSVQQNLVPYLANHNLNLQVNLGSESILIPQYNALDQVNSVNGVGSNGSVGSLGAMAENCTATWGRAPAWLLVDFYEDGNSMGSVFEVAAKLNNVTYTRSCCGENTSLNAATSLRSPATLVIAIALSAILSWTML